MIYEAAMDGQVKKLKELNSSHVNVTGIVDFVSSQ